jgi:hypothetical protein
MMVKPGGRPVTASIPSPLVTRMAAMVHVAVWWR